MRRYLGTGGGGGIAFFHTDCCMQEIIADLIDCGVQIINPQVRANGLEHLVRVCKGKGDRQMFPFASPAEIDQHVKECILDSREGGLWVGAECAPDVPLENIEAICSAMEKYRTYWSRRNDHGGQWSPRACRFATPSAPLGVAIQLNQTH